MDEAGRGAAAGPLVVAAVVLDRGRQIPELNDSKALSAAARERVFDRVAVAARAVSVVVIPAADVDRLGVHVADLAGMRRALARLSTRPQFALIDGFGPAGVAMPSLAVWKGDQVCASVAAAGVMAKVTRDRIMVELDWDYPQYGFAVHKGYLTEKHRSMLALHGPCYEHRRSFEPVRAAAVCQAIPQMVGESK